MHIQWAHAGLYSSMENVLAHVGDEMCDLVVVADVSWRRSRIRTGQLEEFGSVVSEK